MKKYEARHMVDACYHCIYRRGIVGDCHSRCQHPKAWTFGVDGWVFLNIEADLHGMKSGWFNWPLNFDPVWLLNCSGFKQKEGT